ncbi:hypothetical protein B0O80DRAFT_291714 [Mortierella sp. GBAus27b]|nr:hypothetical protein B0O80DRAFT_291714 [Mortierella sp. GBAus27b]
MDISTFCNDGEGWGPTSSLRPDLTPCLENTILLTLPSLVIILGFLYKTPVMLKTGKPHGLGRTNIIYWPTQALMLASAIALIARAAVLKSEDYAPATLLSTICMIVAWLLAIALNHLQHEQSIRSSDLIFAYYVLCIASSAINIRTMALLDQTDQSQFKAFAAFFSFNVLGFLIEALPRGNTQVQKNSDANYYNRSNLLSRVTFHYLQPVISKGFRVPLVNKDIEGTMPEELSTKSSYERINTEWQTRVARCQARGTQPNLLWTVLKSHGWSWVPVFSTRFASSTLTFILPQLLSQLLEFIGSYQTPNPQPVSLGIILAFGMFFASVLSTLCMAQYFQYIMVVSIESRTALIAMVYRKSLKLSSAAKQKSTAGEINNHMSVDAEKWCDALPLMPMLLSTPYEIALAVWMLYQQLGWSVFAGLGTIVALTPLNIIIARSFMSAKSKKLEAMDQRVRLMNELLAGVKVIKLYGWDDPFRDRVNTFRRRELGMLSKIGFVHTILAIMFNSVSLIVALVSFAVFATHGGEGGGPGDVTPQRIFVSISLFVMLTRPLGLMAQILAESIGLTVASRRLQKFLLAEEIVENTSEITKAMPDDPSVPMIEIKDGAFAWAPDGPEIETEKEKRKREKLAAKKYRKLVKEARKAGKPAPEKEIPFEKNYGPTLVGINLRVARGDLTAIVGRVGQGKTSLLNALIGDMYKRQGSIKVHGRLAYVSQQAWIVNATLQDNIMFGNAFDQARYNQVLMACGLLPDIAMLPAGDQTEIGERGINLSGGQKQRVALARAAYENADVYLLDDPLSAVDAHVDQHLWQHLIGPTGLLKDKTRILVTHAIHHLEHTDQIVVLKDGKIAESGQYATLMEAKASLYQLITDYTVNQGKKKEEGDQSDDSEGEDDEDDVTEDGVVADAEVVEKKDGKAGLVEEETMVLGGVSWDVYKTYAKAASLKYSALVIILFALGQATQIGTNVWLKYWSTATDKHTVGEFLGVYAALIVGYMVLNAGSGYSTMVLAAIRASTRLHERLLTKMLRLPMSFFDTTPLGRIVNRFSSDMHAVDELTPWNFINVFLCGSSVLGTLVVIASTTPVFLALVPPLVVAYIAIQSYYMRTSRMLKRIDSVSRSPIYQHFSETLSGTTTIRAFGANERFIADSAAKTDRAANAFFTWIVSNRWLQVRLEALGALIVLAAALFAVLSRNSLGSANVGLALSYALGVTQDITWLVRSYCDLQNQLVAVERIDEYANKNPEAPAETDVKLPENWPQAGHVEFRNYSTRYREKLDLVIKNISFDVQPGEKVGICGRTGAGKSSLTLALFRIIEAANSHWAKASYNKTDQDADTTEEEKAQVLEKVEVEEDGGSIWIDGVDISTVGLKYLRQHLAIIPQEPTLFVGTIRENLDPFDELQDADLWQALERAHLKDYVSSLAGGLGFKVSQNGDNFSVGQRALICLARALLRTSKILVLDEATAAVDVETDDLIQSTIRKEFKDRTILTIAHRIKTIMDSDKILVLEKGRVEEYESPRTLLQRPESLFYKLAEQAGEIDRSGS